MNDSSSEIAIKVEGLSKVFKLPHEKRSSIKSAFVSFFRRQSYEKQKVLNDISFDIKQGEFFGIVGRNGSGKSTLLKILAGIYSPTSGGVTINGKLTPFIELGVGFNPELTGRENVFLNGALLGFNRKEMSEMYDEIVEFAELKKFMDQKLKNYSSGMQVRLAFSIAIRAKSDILLIDEVLAVGDSAFQQKCFNYFKKLKKDKKTVVFVSHDMSAITRFCDEAIYMVNGNITRKGPASEIAELYKLENIDVPKDTGLKLSQKHMLESRMIEQTDDQIKLLFKYKSYNKVKMYIGFSIIRDGISIAELTTPTSEPLVGNGKISYSLATSALNTGVYQMTSALCRAEDRSALAIGKDIIKFVVKSPEDSTRGGALKLPNNWK
ncbi:MAG TPA: ABC transporter ATP-binding protein [Candidatus Saccharibacteria bacterium]|nr:ABC transporter ATP-binding protein [Candidatus Saccharibacteria bacterium]